MQKLVIVINGIGGVGKDTVCDIIRKHYDAMNISSIDPIKKIALENGWNGEKDEKTRKFLADLKQLFIHFNDLPQKYLMNKYQEFMQSGKEVLFVHIREPEEIAKFKSNVGGNCVTLLVRGREELRKAWNNAADDAVEQYVYDFVYENVKDLESLEEDFLQFFRKQIIKTEG